MRVFVLGNGSSGNCLVVEAEGERLAVDAGLGANRSAERMRSLGGELVASKPGLGVVITHDHGDHASHAAPLSRALRAPIYAHDRATLAPARSKVDVRSYAPGKPLRLGPFEIEALVLPHDAPHVALRVGAGDKRFAIVTDLGHAPRDLRAFLGGCDLVFLESNYCPVLLGDGAYPPRLKSRITGPLGHLANEQAADLAASLEDTRVARLVLVHLSRSNNTPERARETVASRVKRLPVEVLSNGEAKRFDVARGGGLRHAEQLGLGF